MLGGFFIFGVEVGVPPGPWSFPRKPRRADAPALIPYPKPLLTFREQAERLVERGMGGDVAEIERRLSVTNYYRLTGYFYFFRIHQGQNRHLGEEYRPGTTFDLIWELYTFDSRLRALVIVAIEKIEVAIRTLISYHHGHHHEKRKAGSGILAYVMDPDAIKLSKRLPDGTFLDRRPEFLAEVQKSLERSHELFIEHFYDTYSDGYPPIYIVSEVLTLGCLKQIYEGSPEIVQREISNRLHLKPSILASWLLTLNTARNVCAHHGRFWNRSLGSKPAVPTDEMFHKPVEVFAQPTKSAKPPTTFAIMSICNYLLHEIDPGCGWAKEVKKLLGDFARVKKISMGFPDNWTMSPIWHDCD